MEHLAQKEDIHMHPNSAHLLALSEDKNDEVEVLDQGMTNYQSTEDMSETISLLHYSSLTGTFEDGMWIIDSGASRHMMGDQARLSNLNEKMTSCKVELGEKTTYHRPKAPSIGRSHPLSTLTLTKNNSRSKP
jgi:hypothetical protein